MSVDSGIFFSEIFPATKQSVNRKCYSMIFSIADKTELNMDIARRQARINQLVREMLVEASDSMSFFHPSWKFWFIFIRFGFELCFLDVVEIMKIDKILRNFGQFLCFVSDWLLTFKGFVWILDKAMGKERNMLKIAWEKNQFVSNFHPFFFYSFHSFP